VAAALSFGCHRPGEKEPSPVEDTFERAANTTGAEYLEAERQLRRWVAEGRADAEQVIKRGAAGSRDPITKLLADALLAARGPAGQDYDELEKIFVNLPMHTNRTPLGSPPPAGFKSIITRRYGARATKFLALRLVKDPDEPAWLAWGSFLYLQEHKDPATTAAILRFIIVTRYVNQREMGGASPPGDSRSCAGREGRGGRGVGVRAQAPDSSRAGRPVRRRALMSPWESHV
jgi:hypothetical protein